MASWECGERGDMLGFEQTWPWPRRRRAVAVAGAGELGAGDAGDDSENREDEEVAELTAIMVVQSARLEEVRWRRSGEGDLRWHSVKTRSMKTVQSMRALGARPARRSGQQRNSGA